MLARIAILILAIFGLSLSARVSGPYNSIKVGSWSGGAFANDLMTPAFAEGGSSGPSRYPDRIQDWPGVGVVRVFGWMKSQRREFWKQRDSSRGSVAFAGDSLTGGWRSLAADFPNLHVVNRGLGGEVSRGLLFRFDEDILALRPPAVVILIGINDLTARQPPAQTLSNIQSMLQLKRQGAPETFVILCTVPPSDNPKAPVDTKDLATLNDGIRRIAFEDTRIILVDLFSAFSAADGSPITAFFGADRLHLSAAGYLEWRKLLISAFRKAGLL